MHKRGGGAALLPTDLQTLQFAAVYKKKQKQDMAKLMDIVRNSPLMRRKGGGYAVLETESKDPFVQGINFSAHYLGAIEVECKQDSPEVREKVKSICTDTAVKKRKVRITVKSNNLQVTDTSSKASDTYPIFLVAYCGGHPEFEDIFYFIQKTKLDHRLLAEVFKFSDAQRVRAVTLTVAKAFNIAFKAWSSQKKKRERANSRGSESPIPQRKNTKPSGLTAKMAPGISPATGPYTPPPPRRPVDEQESGRRRSNSTGESEATEGVVKNPAILRVVAKNENTGSTHNVMLTNDFDKDFQELAETRARPDVLRTSLAVDDTDGFTMEAIKAFIDSQVEN